MYRMSKEFNAFLVLLMMSSMFTNEPLSLIIKQINSMTDNCARNHKTLWQNTNTDKILKSPIDTKCR